MILLIDNYDSFTYNLVQLLASLGAEVRVERNDALSAEEALALAPAGIVISPGPGTPDDAGISRDVIRLAAEAGVPVLGVCLGHQCLAEVFGGQVCRAPEPIHGKTDEIRHDGSRLFAGISNPFVATRYHSLCVDDAAVPKELEVTARTSDGLVMALAHRELPLYGVQFHPESVLTAEGGRLLANFLEIAEGRPAEGLPADGQPAEGRWAASGDVRDLGGVASVADAIAVVSSGRSMTEAEAHRVMGRIMDGEATSLQIAALAVGLRIRGETVDEIVGLARAMRERATPVCPTVAGCIDVCGTGGDGLSTFNISTTAAFVVAGAGVPVAKHGNRAVSSRAGSADVLEALGVDVTLGADDVARCIDECGVGFIFAPTFHAGMRHAAEARREIGIRTVFNILGPLTNPARASRQVIGVYDALLAPMIAEAAVRLGVERVCVVHGHPGLDEVSASGPTRIAEGGGGAPSVCEYDIVPEALGITPGSIEDILGGDAHENAAILRAVLGGEPGPRRDVVLMNAAVALYAAGAAPDFAAGITAARESVDSGRALAALEALAELSTRLAARGKGRA